MNLVEEVLCSRTHECVFERDGFYYIGITDYIINFLDEIVLIELPDVGYEFAKGDLFATIQGVNLSLDLRMPISGTVVEINEEIVDNYDKLKEKSWLIKVESNTAANEVMDLYDYDDYLDLI